MAAIREELGCSHMTARRLLARNVQMGLIVRQGQSHGKGVTWRGLRRTALCRSVFELAGAMTIEYAGARVTLAEAVRMAGMDYQTVIDRMANGLSIDAALSDSKF